MPGEFGHAAHKLTLTNPHRLSGAVGAVAGLAVVALGAITLLVWRSGIWSVLYHV